MTRAKVNELLDKANTTKFSSPQRRKEFLYGLQVARVALARDREERRLKRGR